MHFPWAPSTGRGGRRCLAAGRVCCHRYRGWWDFRGPMLTRGCRTRTQGLASMPRVPIEEALDELRAFDTQPQPPSLLEVLSHLARHSRRFHDIVKPPAPSPSEPPTQAQHLPPASATHEAGPAPVPSEAVATPQPPPPPSRLRLWTEQVRVWHDNGCRPRLVWRALGRFATPAVVRGRGSVGCCVSTPRRPR